MSPLIVHTLMTFKGSPWIVAGQFLLPRGRRNPAGGRVSGTGGLFVASVRRGLVVLVGVRCMSTVVLAGFTLGFRRRRFLFR